MKLNLVWLRRDLRLDDNTALKAALQKELPVLLLFIFDTSILEELKRDDARVSFIYRSLLSIHLQLRKSHSGLLIKVGHPEKIWHDLIAEYDIDTVFVNRDYEPHAIQRDETIEGLLKKNGIRWLSFKDQVIFEPSEILKKDSLPYTVFTPYKKRWLESFSKLPPYPASAELNFQSGFFKHNTPFPSLTTIGFAESRMRPPEFDLSKISNYDQHREFPALRATTFVGPFLRFGIISIRSLINQTADKNQVYLSELIWREFFMQVIFHYPQIVDRNFKPAFDHVPWRNNPEEFSRWCGGNTGYPLVDAGMRQLNATGFMHNRARMVVASFLCKHLLIDWRWGEAYFASLLFDYELSSNNGNWQWATGTGCDAAPYFRVFNPLIQAEKFDPKQNYVSHWIPELNSSTYAKPIVDHAFARQRAIDTYRHGLTKPHF